MCRETAEAETRPLAAPNMASSGLATFSTAGLLAKLVRSNQNKPRYRFEGSLRQPVCDWGNCMCIVGGLSREVKMPGERKDLLVPSVTCANGSLLRTWAVLQGS